MPGADVVTTADLALGFRRRRAADVIEERQVVDIREVVTLQVGEACETQGDDRVAQRAFEGHVVRQVGGERDRRQQFGEPQKRCAGFAAGHRAVVMSVAALFKVVPEAR